MKLNIFGLTVAIVFTLAGGIQPIHAQQETPPSATTGSDSEPTDVLPPDIQANAALVEVISLSQSGVSEDVIENYIVNVQSAFSLAASDIIYLKDIGLPDSAVTAMIQHDQKIGATAPAPTAQTSTAPAPATTDVSDNGFYDSLAPYGAWVTIEGYGRCWRPAAVVYDSSWQPYCDHGRWIYTDDGWYWISDYSWGWATFHYGRWFRDTHYGWCWYPDTVWGPSWVVWRYSDDYCGWAPLPPHCEYREGVGLFYNGARVSVGFDFSFGVGLFTFVPASHFCDPHPARYRVDRTHMTQIYNHTTVINNFGGNNTTIINNGIPRDHIAAVTHTQIRQVSIHESSTPVGRGERLEQNGNALVINRPHFDRNVSQNQNDSHPHTIPSPTTGAPMQVPPPNQNRNNHLPAQNRNVSPNQTPVRSTANENGNGNSPNRNSPTMTQQQDQNHPQVETPAQSRTPTFAPPANQAPDNNSRTMSPRMSQQQSPTPRSITPPTQRPQEQQNYGAPYNAQPSPHIEHSQPQEKASQPAQSQPQQSAPAQQQNRDKDKNDH